MSEPIDREDLVRRLRGAAAGVREQRELLSQLDSHGGDGDHGTTMARAMTRLEEALNCDADPGVGPVLEGVGWAILGVDGGATGPLLGSFFLAMGEEAGSRESLDAPALAAAFEAGLQGIQKHTRAEVGDKTLLDALAPAVACLRAAADAGRPPVEALAEAAAAAEEGAAATRDLRPRFGRAKNAADQSAGHPDPGATSIALLLRGLSQGADHA